MDVPIACTLTAAAARSQLSEWHDLVAASVVATDRRSPTELTFRLRPDLRRLVEIVMLAQREKACCAFFDFTVTIDAASVALRVTVPSDATAVLDDFARLGA